MVEIDVSNYDGVELVVFTVADLSAILWGLSKTTDISPSSLLGDAAPQVLILVGLIGVYSLAKTWTDIDG